jgi:hypothetical protein
LLSISRRRLAEVLLPRPDSRTRPESLKRAWHSPEMSCETKNYSWMPFSVLYLSQGISSCLATWRCRSKAHIRAWWGDAASSKEHFQLSQSAASGGISTSFFIALNLHISNIQMDRPGGLI